MVCFYLTGIWSPHASCPSYMPKITVKLKYSLNYETSSLPPPLASIPTYLWRSPAAVPRRKRSRQLGKRAGEVRLKALLRANNGSDNMSSGCQAFKRHLSLYCIRPIVPTCGSPSPAGWDSPVLVLTPRPRCEFRQPPTASPHHGIVKGWPFAWPSYTAERYQTTLFYLMISSHHGNRIVYS